ncbi:uncharacterized protein LOC111632047 [Centruroides sculpturatus]|uniref:uncharacterized protein LOC111632047 n=1 Tax=Centruroides sculpturatus TaxID=218467 RepID=UPI000C6DBDFB|nr:uncharacterized protein LOC111632047 [Centruroides sculpturatus]
MGNSSSHSVQLAQTRLSLCTEETKNKRYASPENKVLPPPISGQRLRSTDNGSILHNGGTISGRKNKLNISETDLVKATSRKCDSKPIYGHRKSHSDPDIIRRMMASSDMGDQEIDNHNNRKSIIAISPSKAKIKSRKKIRAPEPPLSSSLPRDLNRFSLKNDAYNGIYERKNSDCYLPSIPPPPPPPDYNNKDDEKTKNISNYEKNRRSLDKWRLSKNARDEKLINKSFDKMDENSKMSEEDRSSLVLKENEERPWENLKKYYFADVECLKPNVERKEQTDSKSKSYVSRSDSPRHTKAIVSNTYLASDQLSPITKVVKYTKKDLQPSLSAEKCKTKQKLNDKQRFYKYSNEEPEERLESSSALSWSEEEDIDIDLQLKPTLPKRLSDVSRFSPTEVWKSIIIDPKSNMVLDPSSDEGEILEDKIQRISKPIAPKRQISDRCEDSGISPDDDSPLLHRERSSGKLEWSFPIEENMNSAWVPQHDLLDDSEGEDAPCKKRLPQIINMQPKFTLPNNMFTGQKYKDQESSSRESDKVRHRKKKENKSDHFNSLRNFKKVLGFRAKSSGNQNGLDANWSLSRSLPDFVNGLQIADNSKDSPKSQRSMKEEKIWRNNSTSFVAKQDQKQDDNSRENMLDYSRRGHVMYLPEYETTDVKSKDQDKKSLNDKQKFAYKSTIRKVERKMLEQKLSKEILEKEMMREKEKEWMKKVEEEFKKQRERDKQKKILSSEFREDKHCQNNHNRWKHQTGMGKWLRRSTQRIEVRPEPEGGRSSGEESRHTELNFHSERQHSNIEPNNDRFIDTDDLVKEQYGIHTEIRRTGSGRTFQSHSYYMIESHEELYEDIKDAKMQTLDSIKNKSRLNLSSQPNMNVRKKIKKFEVHSRKKKSSLDDSESSSEEEQIVCDNRKRNERWDDSETLEHTTDSPIGFCRNHPLRNNARIKNQGSGTNRNNKISMGDRSFVSNNHCPPEISGYNKKRDRYCQRNEVYQLI